MLIAPGPRSFSSPPAPPISRPVEPGAVSRRRLKKCSISSSVAGHELLVRLGRCLGLERGKRGGFSTVFRIGFRVCKFLPFGDAWLSRRPFVSTFGASFLQLARPLWPYAVDSLKLVLAVREFAASFLWFSSRWPWLSGFSCRWVLL